MPDHWGGITQRVVSTVVVTAGAMAWQLFREQLPDGVQEVPFFSTLSVQWIGVKEAIWPPSLKSMPFLGALIFCFAILVKRTFFTNVETMERKRICDVKRRQVLLQMEQALRWNRAKTTGPEDVVETLG
jgi:hypothetical protein